MHPNKQRQQFVEGVVRRRVGPGAHRRATLDPFSKTLSKEEANTSKFHRPRMGNVEVAESGEAAKAWSPTQKFDLVIDDEFPDVKKKRIGRRAKRKTHAPAKRRRRRILLAIGAVILIIGGIFASKLYFAARNIFRGNSSGALAKIDCEDPNTTKNELDSRINVLLLGIGGDGHEGPNITDTLLIASIDACSKETSLISIPRDLYMKAPGYWAMRINSVYASAKAKTDDTDEAIKALEETIEANLGMRIDYYGMIDFNAFKQAVDALGGIEIDVKEDLIDPTVARDNGGSPVIAKKGKQTFNGQKALLYARSRKGSARGDFDRNERQREIVLALREKVLSLGTFSNPYKIYQLLGAASDNVRTNFSEGELQRLYDLGSQIQPDKITSAGIGDEGVNLIKSANIGGASVQVPAAGQNNFADIQTFIRKLTTDGRIKKEGAKVVILNGSGKSGLAKSKAEELKSYGYDVVSVGDAQTSTTTQVIVVDKAKSPFTLHFLENRFNTTASSGSVPSNQPQDANIVIIMGKDAVSQ